MTFNVILKSINIKITNLTLLSLKFAISEVAAVLESHFSGLRKVDNGFEKHLPIPSCFHLSFCIFSVSAEVQSAPR